MSRVLDPVKFARAFWPDMRLYREQRQWCYSVQDNDETVVVAGNKLGKDFTSAFIALWWFCSRRPARVVTTSVKMEQLNDVLWGEIRRLIALAVRPLPLQYNHMRIRRRNDDGTLDPRSELVGQVSNTQEGLLGRHASGSLRARRDDLPRTLVIFDEASGVDDTTYNSVQTWAERVLIVGNPWPTENFFRRAAEAGDAPRDPADLTKGYHRKVFRVRAEDSPNVRLALAEQAAGREPSGAVVVPGVKTWAEYRRHRATWDAHLQCVGLDAEFYKGAEVLLFPPESLARSAEEALLRVSGRSQARGRRCLGCDPGEGAAHTAWAVGDAHGLLELVAYPTPNTAEIKRVTLELMRKWGVADEDALFDRGGGGLQVAHELRESGRDVRTVGFGEAVSTAGVVMLDEVAGAQDDRYGYVNRRAQMYGELALLVTPGDPRERPYALPSTEGACRELHRQLGRVPRLRDGEGRLYLPPKDRRPGDNSKTKTLTELIGRSPDEADAVALMAHALLHPGGLAPAGPAW